MKKLMCLLISLFLCFSLVTASLAADNRSQQNFQKIERSELATGNDGSVYQPFSGDCLIIKQARYALVWTASRLSCGQQKRLISDACQADKSLKKCTFLFKTGSEFTLMQNRVEKRYCVLPEANGHALQCRQEDVSHILVCHADPPAHPTVTPAVATVTPSVATATPAIATATPLCNREVKYFLRQSMGYDYNETNYYYEELPIHSSYIVRESMFSRDGYEFVCWSRVGSGKTYGVDPGQIPEFNDGLDYYAPGTEITLSSSCTFYGVWSK